MVINTNVEASSTANNLNVSQSQLAKSLSRLSSGSKIIQPSDDAAGLAVASRLKAQIKRLDSALSNVINAVSFTQTQDGFMKTIDAALRRMGELAMLAQDTTKSGDDIKLYNEEFTQLKDYINATKLQKFNDVDLFGSSTLAVTVDAGGSTFGMPPVDLGIAAYNGALGSTGAVAQVDTITVTGAGDNAADKFNVTVNGTTINNITVGTGSGATQLNNTATAIANAINADGTLSSAVTATTDGAKVIITAKTAGTAFSGTTSITGVSGGGSAAPAASVAATTANVAGATVTIDTGAKARLALVEIKEAISQIAKDRAQLGAVQSRLNFSNEQLVVTKENLSSAISRITDVDVAEEATQYARYLILVQSGTQMLRQANQLPASALQLLTS